MLRPEISKLSTESFANEAEKVEKVDTNSSLEIEEDKSIGVAKAEILAAQWAGKWHFQAILLSSAFLAAYGYGLDLQIRSIYTGYATASYSQHSLLTTVGVISSVAGAACQPIFSRLSDVFGRLEIFLVSVIFYVVGTIIESQARDVQRYSAGSVFYMIGYLGTDLMVTCILADCSSLGWRLFYVIIPSLPLIINTWISGNVVSAVGPSEHWSWGVGMWAFIFPLCCLPFVCCMIHMRYLAGKTPEWKLLKQRKTKFQELGFLGFFNWLFWKLDVFGLFLLTVCLGCLLVPLTLAGGEKSKWQEGSIIAPLVIGVLLIPGFTLWEGYGAKHPAFPFKLLRDRGVWAALLICFLLFFILVMQASYNYAVLMVLINQTETSATRIVSLDSFVQGIAGIFFGLVMVYLKRMKVFVIFGCCIWMVALGILLHFRQGPESYSGIIGGIVLLGIGSTFIPYPTSVLLQSCTNHEHMAVIISLGYTFLTIGSAVGNAAVGAIWTQVLFGKLKNHMKSASLAAAAYADPYTFIEEFPWGTPERNDMAQAYKEIQKILLTVALCFVVPMLLSAFLLRDHVMGSEQSGGKTVQNDDDDTVFAFISFIFNKKHKQTTAEASIDSDNKEDSKREEIA